MFIKMQSPRPLAHSGFKRSGWGPEMDSLITVSGDSHTGGL